MTDLSRAEGALFGVAIGDALGMPTQSLPRDAIVARYGPLLGSFEPAPPDHPLAAGRPAGSVTDDTEQALLLAGLLLEGGGRADPAELARRLLAWEEAMRVRGSPDLLRPSAPPRRCPRAPGRPGGRGQPGHAQHRGGPGRGRGGRGRGERGHRRGHGGGG